MNQVRKQVEEVNVSPVLLLVKQNMLCKKKKKCIKKFIWNLNSVVKELFLLLQNHYRIITEEEKIK